MINPENDKIKLLGRSDLLNAIMFELRRPKIFGSRNPLVTFYGSPGSAKTFFLSWILSKGNLHGGQHKDECWISGMRDIGMFQDVINESVPIGITFNHHTSTDLVQDPESMVGIRLLYSYFLDDSKTNHHFYKEINGEITKNILTTNAKIDIKVAISVIRKDLQTKLKHSSTKLLIAIDEVRHSFHDYKGVDLEKRKDILRQSVTWMILRESRSYARCSRTRPYRLTSRPSLPGQLAMSGSILGRTMISKNWWPIFYGTIQQRFSGKEAI